MMTADVLEKVLVQRGDLANRLVEVIRESVLTPAKHHTLVIGSRGIGKTHLLSLVQNRIASQEDITERVRVAWLREEEWGVASFLDFLYRILRALASRYQDDALRDETETLFSLPIKTAERRAADLLRSFIEGKTLLLITENLDCVFQGLGKKGQQRLRAYLQEESSWTILASSQALFGGVALYESPFYGFFDIHYLQELTVDDAAQLVQSIAELANDQALAAYVQSESGRARIRAVHHLAGGNHRVYMILSEFLTRDSLDQLVDPFLRMMDDLTPYYQARMEQLSPQQRKIVDLLCSVRGAVPVKEIARRCFITSQTASSQLKDLRDRGYVDATPVGRDAYYELAEPLMRLALEVKNQRNGHIRLFLDFLRYWYARPELVDLLAQTPAESTMEREYLQWALSSENEDPALQFREFLSIAERLWQTRDWKQLLPISEKLVQERGSVLDWTLLGTCLTHTHNHDEAISVLNKALELDSTYPDAWMIRSLALVGSNKADEALEAINTAIMYDDNNAAYHGARAVLLAESGRLDDALVEYDRTLELAPNLALGWTQRADVLLQLRRYAEGLESVNHALALEPTSIDLWLQRARIAVNLGYFADAIADLDRVLEENSAHPQALWGRVVALMGLGDDEQALEAAQRAHDLWPESPIGNWLLARQLVQLGSFHEALPFLAAAETGGFDKSLLLEIRFRALFALELLDDGRKVIECFAALPRRSSAARTVALLVDLFRSAGGEKRREKVSIVYSAFRDHGRSGLLAADLVDAGDVLLYIDTPVGTARKWVELWREVAGPDEDFAFSLRLLDALVTHREVENSRALLGLSVEERRIAEEILSRARDRAGG
jgi:tetratricopeptide (TPR) repeat protein